MRTQSRCRDAVRSRETAQCLPPSVTPSLTGVVTNDNMNHDTRPVGWVSAARKMFESFPATVRDRVSTALTIAAEGAKADIAKPLKGFGPGVMEIAVRYRTDAWRVVYVTELAGRLWVIHAFRKKSKTGIRTPKAEIDLVRSRLARLKREMKP